MKTTVVLCVRKHPFDGRTIVMALQAGDYEIDIMDREKAEDVARTHALCQISEVILVDIETGESEFA